MKPDENTPPPNPPPDGHLVSAQGGPLGHLRDGEWYPPGTYPEHTPPPGGGLSAYLHALRRRWLSVTALGLLCAAVLGTAVWFAHVSQYTAISLIEIPAGKGGPWGHGDRDMASERWRQTQIQYVTSDFVLMAALRKLEIATLPTVQEEPDPVAWMKDRLRVAFPGNSELMRVSLKGKNPKELAALVDAVVEAYKTEVVDKERAEENQRLSDYEEIYAEQEAKFRDRWHDLNVLVEDIGTGDPEALSLKQRQTLEAYATLRKELVAIQIELMRAEGQLKVIEKALERAGSQPVSETEVAVAARADPQMQQLLANRNAILVRLDKVNRTAKREIAAQYERRDRPILEEIDGQIKAGEEKLRKDLERRKQAAIARQLVPLQSQVEHLRELERQLAQDVESRRKEAETIGGGSIDIQLLTTEINSLEQTLQRIDQECQDLKIKSKFPSPIEVVQPATVPRSPDRDKKVQLILVAILAGFFVPGCVIVWWDIHGRRVNTSAEVAQGTGLEVIGAMPIIPATAARHLAGTSRRDQRWRAMLAESVDAIAARLLRQAELDQTRVVLVSSAVAGEGKTTVATQLALSLARSGHRTVLVDFDLRRPAIDQLLGLPLEPGVSEMLRQESEFQEVVRQTADADFAVVTAGRWSHTGMGVLANGVAGGFIDKLREEFEFVVVDGSPILPVVDARFLSRYVDGVVLAVLRDVSRIPKIVETCEILGKFGARALGAVVTGSSNEGYYSHGYYGPRDST